MDMKKQSESQQKQPCGMKKYMTTRLKTCIKIQIYIKMNKKMTMQEWSNAKNDHVLVVTAFY